MERDAWGFRTAWCFLQQVARTARPLSVALVGLQSLVRPWKVGSGHVRTCALVMVTKHGRKTVPANSGAARASVLAHMAGVSGFLSDEHGADGGEAQT